MNTLLAKTEKKSFSDLKLNLLIRLTEAINLNAKYDELMEIFNEMLADHLKLNSYVLVVKRRGWELALQKNLELKVREIDFDTLSQFDDATELQNHYIHAFQNLDVLIPIKHKDERLAYLAIERPVHLDTEDQGKSLIHFLQTLTSVLLVAIENKRLTNEALRQIEIKKELEIAKEMQQFLFPSDLPKNELMDVDAKYLTHREVGGDYYDFFPISEDKYVFCIADVSGKGISAALLMANFQAIVRTLAIYQNFDIEEFVNELNTLVYQNAKGEKFITFFMGVINVNTRELTYINAGHNTPILTDGKNHQFLDTGTTGLGMFEELPFLTSDRIVIPKNATISLYTDGVIELVNQRNEQFEVHRLIQTLHSFYPLKTEDINNLLFSKLDEWRGSNDFVDDTAILTCRFY